MLRSVVWPQARSTFFVAPSPSPYWPNCVVIWAPSKLRRVMMFTTPAIASEPYSDEAPSCRISMRSTIASGIVLRSVAAPTPDAEDSLTQRMPSTSTSTRLGPRWRRSTCEEPAPTPSPLGENPKLPLELNFVLSAEPAPVSSCTRSPSEVRPERSMSSRLSTCTGTWLSTSAFLIRVPVTEIRSRVLSEVGVGAGVDVSCAAAMPGNRSNRDKLTAVASRLGRSARMRGSPESSWMDTVNAPVAAAAPCVVNNS